MSVTTIQVQDRGLFRRRKIGMRGGNSLLAIPSQHGVQGTDLYGRNSPCQTAREYLLTPLRLYSLGMRRASLMCTQEANLLTSPSPTFMTCHGMFHDIRAPLTFFEPQNRRMQPHSQPTPQYRPRKLERSTSSNFHLPRLRRVIYGKLIMFDVCFLFSFFC